MASFIKKIVFNKCKNKTQVRGIYGVCCSSVGLLCNIILFVFKITIGVTSSSVSIIADSFNNLSDALSYVITIIAFRFIAKSPDDKHPFGYGRVEYVCSLVVCVLIFMTGVELFKSSISEIVSPSDIEINPLVYIALFFSVLLKLYLSRFFRKAGREINSSVLTANARDSFMDVFSTTAILLGLFISKKFNLSLDGYLGLFVTGLILHVSFKTFKENIGPILGESPSEKFVSLVKDKIKKYEEIEKITGIALHNYGESRAVVHLKVLVNENLELKKVLNKISEIEEELGKELLCSFIINFDIK